MVYRDGKDGVYFVKRFNVTSITHDREYDVTMGKPGSRITYFTANTNGEAEVIKITLKPDQKLRKIFFDFDFSTLMVKGRSSRGNMLSKNSIFRIQLKLHGASTLGGRKVWFDHDVQRLNYDGQGQYLGEFHSDDLILVVLKNGDFYTTNFDLNNHFETEILMIRMFRSDEVFTAVLRDASQQNYVYVKRFCFERTVGTRHQNCMGDNQDSELLLLTDTAYPRLQITYGGHDSFREPFEIDAEQFIAVKGFKAKGKRLSTYEIESITELEPVRFPEEPAEEPEKTEEPVEPETPDNPEDPDIPESPESQKSPKGPESPDSSEPLQLSLDF